MLLCLVFAPACLRADITTAAGVAHRELKVGPRSSTHLAYANGDAQPTVGHFSRFGANDKTDRLRPSVSTMIGSRPRDNYESMSLDVSEVGIMPRSAPEAGTLGLMGIGLLGIAMVARRRITARIT